MLRLMDFGVFAAFDVEVSAGGETHVQEVLGMVPNEELGFDPGAAAADIVQVRLPRLTRPGSRHCAAAWCQWGSPPHVWMHTAPTSRKPSGYLCVKPIRHVDPGAHCTRELA